MSLASQTSALRKQWQQWAADPEWPLLVRYELQPQKSSPWWYRLSQWPGRRLRLWGLSRGKYKTQTWHPGLKHAWPAETGNANRPRPLLLWADLNDLAETRTACQTVQERLANQSGLCPVLVTGVADFAFYSRLGWLVEYLPTLSPASGAPTEEKGYDQRKQRYLAWRYRDALVLPLSAGLASQEEWESLIQGEKR